MHWISIVIKKFLIPAVATYVILCFIAYMIQERLIFFPQKLPADYEFKFRGAFSEEFIPAADGALLHGLLFKAAVPQGVVFYLHGNAGANNSWGNLYPLYTSLGYDFFILDYRGYGKSEGSISSEQQFLDDADQAYLHILSKYRPEDVVIVGYSLGSAPATMLAAKYNPKALILKAPFYNLQHMARTYYPIIPGFLLKYKFENNRYLQQVQSPITIFHGDKDEVVPYESSLMLKNYFKPGDELITLPGQFHNDMNYNQIYLSRLLSILVTIPDEEP